MEEADKQLLKKYNEGHCSKAERARIESWYLSWDDEQGTPSFSQIEDANKEIWSRLPIQQNKIRRYRAISIAASLLLVLGIGLYFYISKNENPAQYVHKIAPGKVGATLSLTNGKKVKLNLASNGTLLRYQSPVHHVSTARGETYQLLLPDGSKVWLNAASSLTYFTNFSENGKRLVKLEGEGYFEVRKDELHPFTVKSKNQEVKVLGTHFNVKAYNDEMEAKTTLVEGSVEVTANGLFKLLRPNEQAKVTNGKITIFPLKADDVVAWTKNEFMFNNESIESMMNSIGRWYNVDIVYLDDLKAIREKENEFGGGISRNIELQQFLRLLEHVSDFKFNIEGNKVLVYLFKPRVH